MTNLRKQFENWCDATGNYTDSQRFGHLYSIELWEEWLASCNVIAFEPPTTERFVNLLHDRGGLGDDRLSESA